MLKKKFSGTIIIGDPCEMVKSEEDWQLSEYGEKFDKLGIKNYLWIESEEDSPIVKDVNGKDLGSFCTDSALIVVILLDELLQYNPQFNQYIEYPENWTVIENFDGIVSSFEKDERVYIQGKGNINFITTYDDD